MIVTSRRLRQLTAAGLQALALASAAAAPSAAHAAVLPASAITAAAKEAETALREEAFPSALERSVQSWIRTLSAQRPFEAWKQAVPSIEALGPGTHGWLVTLRQSDSRPVGYIVVYAAEDGSYRLGEYGLGPQPLFDKAALTRSLVANGFIASHASPYRAEKLYAHPFAAVWRVTIGNDVYWLDAKTDELLPLDDQAWNKVLRSSRQPASDAADSGTVRAVRLNEPFDPYDRLPWLMNEAPVGAGAGGEVLLRRIKQAKSLRFVSEPFGDRMLYALAVVGYQSWSCGRLDLALDMQGTRFIPLDSLRAAGLFYR
ncbi:hypothetical protein [Cohnella thermotolerans]|uniref:hypothetical protein n=1 Tax=Cohnella thermotolerans TaxID=329858 RepID=UPI0012EBF9C6|nr:hypothetical protein [Cohnella thermotolerans]